MLGPTPDGVGARAPNRRATTHLAPHDRLEAPRPDRPARAPANALIHDAERSARAQPSRTARPHRVALNRRATDARLAVFPWHLLPPAPPHSWGGRQHGVRIGLA